MISKLCGQALALDALAAWLAAGEAARRLEARLATRETAQRLTALLAPLVVPPGACPLAPPPSPAPSHTHACPFTSFWRHASSNSSPSIEEIFRRYVHCNSMRDL